jgi:hypothetical protein
MKTIYREYITMSFDPKPYLVNLENNPNKPPRMYLKPVHRLLWFRDVHPTGQILTDLVNVEPAVVKATILDGEGHVMSTGYGSAQYGTNAVWKGREVEKAETAAIGRALAHAGFGTQFTDDDDSDHLADSPSQKPSAPQWAQQPAPSSRPSAPAPFPAGKAELAQQIEEYLDQHGIAPDDALKRLHLSSWGAFPNFEVARMKIDEKLLDAPASKPQPQPALEGLDKKEIPF